MHRRSLIVLVLGILLSSVALSAQTRMEKPNDFTLGLGGQCFLYNLAYQRNLSPNFALELGVSYLGAGASLDDSVSAFFLSGGARFYMLKKNTSPYLSGGVVWVSADTDAGPFDGQGNFYGYISPGFEFRSMGGFVFRGGVYFLIIEGGFFVWPGSPWASRSDPALIRPEGPGRHSRSGSASGSLCPIWISPGA